MMTWYHAIRSVAVTATWGALGLVLLRVTLIVALGRLALALAPRASAAQRHLIMVTTLGALIALPVAMAVVPAWRVPILPRLTSVQAPAPALQAIPAEAFVTRPFDSPDGEVAYGNVIPASRPFTQQIEMPPPVSRVRSGGPASPSRPWSLPRSLPGAPLVLVVVGLAVTEVLLLRLVVSTLAVARLKRSAQVVTNGRLLRALDAARGRLGLHRPIRLLTTSRIGVPVVTGISSPVLLLPREALGWDAERLEVVFLHELAHVRRGDALALLVARAAGAFYWFHPLVGALVRDARRDCERACDDCVIANGVRASSYARHLLSIARVAMSGDTLGGAVLAIARPSNLERRMSSILGSGVRRGSASRLAVVATALGALLILLPLASARVTAAPEPRRKSNHAPDTLSWNWKPSQSSAHRSSAAASSGPVYDTKRPTHSTAPEARSVTRTRTRATYGDEEIDTRSGRDAYSSAKDLYDDERYGEAGEAYERAAKGGHRVAIALYNAACSFALDHQNERALNDLASAIGAGWDDANMIKSDDDLRSLRNDRRFHELLAEVRSTSSDESDRRSALTTYEALRASHSDDPDEWASAGVDLMHSEEPDRATHAFEEQLRLLSSPNGLYNLACAHALSGRTTEALAALEKSILAGYSDAGHMQRDDDLEALHGNAGFDRLIKLTGDLALFEFGRGDDDRIAWRKSVPRFERVTRDYPTLGRAWFNLGYAQLRARDAEGSRASFARALELEYRPATTQYNLACASAQLRDTDAALQWLDRSEAAGMDLASRVSSDKDLEPLRSDARFRAMLERVRRESHDIHGKMKFKFR